MDVISLTVEETTRGQLTGRVDQIDPKVIVLHPNPPITTTGTYVVRYEVRATDNDSNEGGLVFRVEQLSGRRRTAMLISASVALLAIVLAAIGWASRRRRAEV